MRSPNPGCEAPPPAPPLRPPRKHEWLAAALRARGLTQSALAAALGKDRSCVSRFLDGTEAQDPRLSDLTTIARLTGLPLCAIIRHIQQANGNATP